MQKATLVWEAGVKRRADGEAANISNKAPNKTILQHSLAAVKECSNRVLVTITCGRLGSSMSSTTVNNQLSPTANPMLNRVHSNTSLVSATSTTSATAAGVKKAALIAPPLNEEEFLSIVREAHVVEAERIITDLETELAEYRNSTSSSSSAATEVVQPLLHATASFVDRDALYHDYEGGDGVGDTTMISFDQTPHSRSSSPMPTGTGKDVRVLTLSRINLQARAGQLISVVGAVGSGKSSLLSALLGDMRYSLFYFSVFYQYLCMYKLFVFYFILYSLFFLMLYYLHVYPDTYDNMQMLLRQCVSIRQYRLHLPGGLHPEQHSEREHHLRQPLRRGALSTDTASLCATAGYPGTTSWT